MYYPVQVPGGMLSMGDAHAAQADSELDGTGVETSITGTFKISVIKAADLTPAQQMQNFPLGETSEEYIVHGFTETDYLETFAESPGDIYGTSSLDPAMANAYQQTRKFLMAMYEITEAEANTIITQGVDFAVTQVVDGNWGVHSVIPKKIFEPYNFLEVGAEAVASGRQSELVDADLKLSAETVHWGFFSKELEPVMTVTPGQEVRLMRSSALLCVISVFHFSHILIPPAQNDATLGCSGNGHPPRL